MAYATFGPHSPPHPHIEASPVESCAFGIRVGRLDYGIGTDWGSVDVTRDLIAGEEDLVILRYPADRLAITRDLAASGLRFLTADMLLYYHRDTVTTAPHEGITFRRLTRADTGLADDLIADVFTGYHNHYLANPLTSGIDLIAAYQEWTQASLEHPSRAVFAAASQRRPDAGMCMVELAGTTAEILLAGLRPTERGGGLYQALTMRAIEWAASQGATDVVSSTQPWNIVGLRTWTKLGFLPELALTTMHVMPREPRSAISSLG